MLNLIYIVKGFFFFFFPGLLASFRYLNHQFMFIKLAATPYLATLEMKLKHIWNCRRLLNKNKKKKMENFH